MQNWNKCLFILIALSLAHSAFASEWIEKVRTYSLKMIDEASIQAPHESEFINKLRNVVKKSPITDKAPDGFYGMVYGRGPTIHLSYILQYVELPIAAFVLIHEAAHVMGYGEQGAEDTAYFIVKNSISSQGLMHIGYPKLHSIEHFCGKPVIREIPKKVFPDTPMEEKELVSWRNFLEVNYDDIEYNSYNGFRIKNWIGGAQGCDTKFPKEMNTYGVLTNEDYWYNGRGYYQAIVDYLSLKRKPTLDLIDKRIEELK